MSYKNSPFIQIVLGFFSFIISPLIAQNNNNTTILDDELSILSIKEGIAIVHHSFPWESNAALIEVNDSTLVLVDTPITNNATAILYSYIKEKYPNHNLICIGTHFHNDCIGGAEYLIQNAIPVYGSDLTAQFVRTRWEKTKKMILPWYQKPEMEKYRTALEDQKLVAPDELFPIKEGLTLHFGKETVEIAYPGPGHTEDNIVVYFPDKKLLFGGCLIFELSKHKMGFTGDAIVDKWAESVMNLKEMYPTAELVIPGHGEVGDKTLLDHTINVVSPKRID